MPITINGTGSITGISAGGLPDDSIIAADIAAGAVTTAKIADANITAAKLSGAQSGSAPIYGCRAWINFDGTAATIGSGRANGNVSSITDNGTGDYTVNFTTAMQDANYSAVVTVGDIPVPNRVGTMYRGFVSAGSCRIIVGRPGSASLDEDPIMFAVFR